MKHKGTLVFKFEQVIAQCTPNYAEVYRELGETVPPEQSDKLEIGLSLRREKRRLGGSYVELRKRIENLVQKLEEEALDRAKLLPGAATNIATIDPLDWRTAVVSDMGKKPVRDFLLKQNLMPHVALVVARTRVEEALSPGSRLRALKRIIKSLDRAVYFCNSSPDIREAKTLGMQCFALPNRFEPFRSLLEAKPDGVILSLDELPQLLALLSVKLGQGKEGMFEGRSTDRGMKESSEALKRTAD